MIGPAISLTISLFAHGAMWNEVTGRPPNCERDSCLVSNGATSFRISMTVAERSELDYLERLSIKNMTTGVTQDFATPAVNGSENHEAFHLYAVSLQSSRITDLALYAFDSAKAGPAYYYFVYDPRTKAFVQSESTLAKLIWDGPRKTLKTEIQETPYRIAGAKLIATGEPK